MFVIRMSMYTQYIYDIPKDKVYQNGFDLNKNVLFQGWL